MELIARGAGLAVLLQMLAGSAQAALTADQLWAAWQDAGAQAGLSVTASAVSREGASLRLSGVTVTGAGADSSAPAAEARIDEILLTEGADGSVTVLPSPSLAVVAGDEVNGGNLTLRHDGGSVKVTESLGELVYDLSAVELAAEFSASGVSVFKKDDGTDAKSDTTMTVTLADPVVRVTDTPNANRTIGFDLAASALRYEGNTRDEGVGSSSAQTGTTVDLAISGSFAAPKTMALGSLVTPEAWSAAFLEGMAFRIEARQGQSESTAQETAAFYTMDLTATTLPGTTRFSLGRDGYDLRATGEGVRAVVKTDALPVPEVTVDVGPLEFALAMPIMAATTAGAYGLTIRLADVVVNEAAWGMLDATAQLPRDPAQLALVANGTVLVDFLAMMAADSAGMTEVTPPQPLTLDIPELLVSAAGAVLTGSGAFTFDNATGQPVPAGEANLTLTGGNTLIDGLIAAGLLTEEDAGGARMMMSMFMNSAGDDVLTSKIEAKADGSISVNGQRVQ